MKPISDDDIVISGISGRYPKSANLQEFWDNLSNSRPMYSDETERWTTIKSKLPLQAGFINYHDQFDADLFGISDDLANFMDPQQRLLHETTYEAIFDAGLDPFSLGGQRSGFFVGSCYNDTSYARSTEHNKTPKHFERNAQFVCDTFNFHGTSLTVDTACAASFSALHQAMQSFKTGDIDCAVIGALSVHLKPQVTLGFMNLRMLSPEGTSKSLDAGVDGYCRSEAIVSILLQKRKDAKRIYSTIYHSETNCDGYKPEGITFPSMDAQYVLMKKVYEDCKLDPERHITYVEGHMTGTPVGDPVETLAIVKALRPNKSRPLLMGALKSNMGHSEGASALCGISKVALIFQQGYIPPNINYSSPNPNIESLKDGTVIPILENTPFSEDFIALNAFGFGGVNVHAILKANEKQSSPRDYKIFDSKYKLPENWYKKSELHSLKDFDKFVSKCKKGQLIRLVNFPNRTPEGCECAFEFLKNNREKINNDYLQLIEDLCNIDPSTKLNHHGFMTWSPDGEILTKKTAKIDKKRPIHLIFSGLGCQWIQMGSDLLEFEMFARKIVSLNDYCKKNFSFDLIDFMTKAHDEAEFKKDPAKNLIAISSIQMALIDFIKFLEIDITGFIGHSVGEYACAYADGKATSEQIISCIYELVKEVNKLGGGTMASVGLSVKQIESKLPEGVEICCDNSSENVTIGGPDEVIDKLLKKFEKDEIFVRKVDSCGQLYHSKKVEKCYNNVLTTFKKILGSEKLNRSSKWISTSVDKGETEPENLAKYLADNVVKRVLFTEAVNSLKDDICCVEVGPHTQLLPLIKQQKGRLATCVGTMKKNDIGKNLNNIFVAIGEIFNNGHSGKISKLFTPVEYPVSRETLSLSHLVKLNHSVPRFVYRFPEYFNTACLTRQFEITFDNPKYKSWYGHVIDGRILLPATGYLFLAWDVLFQKQNLSAMSNSITIPIEFRDVSLKRAIVLNKGAPTNIKIKLIENTGEFSISESDQVCCSGFMTAITDGEKKIVPELYKTEDPKENKELVQTADIYKELRVRGYDYQGDFQGIIECYASGRQGKVKWNNSWVAFADALLQISILGEKSRSLFVPTYIEYLRCEIDSLNAYCENCKKQNIDPVFEVFFDPVVGVGSSLGMLVKGMKVTETPRRTEKQKAFLQEYGFVPYENNFVLEKDASAKLAKYDETVNKLTKGFANKIEKLEEVELSMKELNDKFNDKDLHSVANLLLDVMKSNHLIEEKPEEKPKEESENTENVESNEIVESKADSKIKTDENNNEIQNTDENNNQEEETKKEVKKLELNETIQERQEALSHDLLFTSNYHLIFANHIAVILENLNSKQVKLLEINYTPSLLMDYLSYQISVAQVRTEYNLYHPMPALKSISSKYGINKVLEIKSDSTISNEFNASHIVAYKHWSTGFINSLETLDLAHYRPNEEQEKTLIKNTFEHLLNGGFLLFCYRTKLTLIEEQLMEFGGQNSQIEFVSREKILGWIKEAGFEYIAEEKSDEQSCSTILARKVSKELVKIVKESEQKTAEENKKEETQAEKTDENKEEAKEEEFEMENPLDPIPIEAKLFDYTWVERVKKELKNKSSRRIWLIARDSTMNGIIGMMKCLKKEPEGERIRCLFNIDECDDKSFVENKIKNGLGVPEYPEEIAEKEEQKKKEEESKKEQEENKKEENEAKAEAKTETKTEDKKEEPKEIELEEISEKEILALKKMISQDLINKDLTTNIIFEKQLGSYRQKVFSPELVEETEYAVLDIVTKGDLSSLRWLSSNMKEGFATPALLYPMKMKVQQEHKELNPFVIDLHYSALNFKDIMVASGRVPRSAYPSTELAAVNAIGMECSGKLKDGSRIMAILPGSGISTKFVLVDKTNLFDVPDDWSLAEAATVPVVYLTVYYSLFLRGKLMKGEKVLIHAGSGGVGFAAISVCLAYGCEVFTTVSNEKKKKFLQEHFPSLQDRNFANSRDVNFEEHILKETNGYGVDIVLNSLSEEKLRASIRCLAPFGRFLEIGKYDIIQNNSIDTTALGQNRTFHAICLAHLLAEMTEDLNGVASSKWTLCCDLLRKGIKNKEVKPLNFTVFKKYECEQAFRYMANGKHMGKVLIEIKPENEEDNSLTKVIPKTKCDPRKSFIITGGLGGFGIELSMWLISIGARNIVLTSRTGIKNTYQEMQVRKMREEGTTVIISNETCDSLESTKRLLETAEKLGPIEGIFHLAMVLQDSIFTNQTRKLFKTVCEPKVNSTFFLDYLTRDEKKYSSLKHFICFSSIASGIGNPGQTNYAFANSAMERIVEKRVKEMGPDSKCKSKAIQWGAIGDVGAFAEKFGNDVNIAGMVPQRIISCMKTMDEIMNYDVSLLSSIVLQDDTKINALGGERGNLVKTIMHVLGVNDPSTLDPNVTLTELGMDSLMAVEIKQGLEREYDIVMTTQEIRGLTYKRLQEMSAELEERDKNKGKNESESEKDNLAKLEEIFNKKEELFIELSTTQSNASNQPIFFVPPIEGDFVVMRKVTKYLTRPVIGINWISEFDDKAKIQDVATIISKRLIEKYGNCEFDFVGYSFGSVLGLEVAIQLQINTSATVRKFIMLDGSPEFTKAKSHEIANALEFTDANSDKIMTTMLVKFSEHVMKVDNLEDFTEKLLKLPDLNSRCQSVVTLIESKFNFKVDQEKMLKAVQSMFNKCRMVFLSDITSKLTGDILLIRATDNKSSFIANSVSESYGIEKVCTGKTEVIKIEGDHITFITNNAKEIGHLIDNNTLYLSI